MNDYNSFEKEVLAKLQASGLIKRFSFNEVMPNPNISLIEELFKYPTLIEADDEGIFYYDENHDKIYCPSMAFSISESGEWLSEKLPPVNFDIEQSGNVRKADEAEALFCCVVVSSILKEEIFIEEVKELAEVYDFENMKHREIDNCGFRALLNDWQNLQSVIINIIISACKYRLSFYKKDIEKFLRDGMPSEEVAGLRDLDAKVRAINFKYSEGVLSPENVRLLSKIERLQFIDKRDSEISACIQSSKFGILYKICNLSSEYINPVKKKKIQTWVRKEVDSLLSEGDDFSKIANERNQILSKLNRRALRFEKNSVRKLNIEKYFEDKDKYA